jgi:hypothetical protein
MSAIGKLKEALGNAFVSRIEPPGVPPGLLREKEALKRYLGGDGRGLSPPRAMLADVVRRFRASGQLDNPTTARWVCFGAAVQFQPTEPPLIEIGVFRKLLEIVESYRTQPRALRRCYWGLLHSYFLYDHRQAPDAGEANWRRLRAFLAGRLASIRVDGIEPEWVAVLIEHKNLLTDDACSRYGVALLNGDRAEINNLRAGLSINQISWFSREIALATIRAATAEYDSAFQRRVGTLLNIIQEFTFDADMAIGLILDRYARIEDAIEHAELRDQAVKRWGSPWLDRKKVNWTRVTPAARLMVEKWLKRDLIRGFFEVLSDDRGTDRRRLEFWLRYHDCIGPMYFALGPTASGSRSADMIMLREKMADHRLELTAGGPSHNNAFIMKMGNYIVVEFGVKGNACYIFDTSPPPFPLRGTVFGDSRGLKHESRLDRLRHADTSEPWEHTFARVLAGCGLHPDGISLVASPRVREPDPVFAGMQPSKRVVLLEYLNEQGLLWDDKTRKGGNLSVLYQRQNGPVADTLKKFGFKHSIRGFWYRPDWPI